MKKIRKILLIILTLLIVYLLFWPLDLKPIARKTPPYPGLKGVFETNKKLSNVNLVTLPHPGPEAVVQDSLGYLYSGLENGDIIQYDLKGENIRFIANTGGRPLGMKFAPSGELIIADISKGLIALDSSGDFRVLVDTFEGEKLLFVDDLDITNDGIIYFSNASQRTDGVVENEAWEQRASGALFSYNMNTNKLALLKDDLFFANGIALNQTEEYFVFSETFGLSLYKYWIKGKKKGEIELFNNSLPGYPDNVTHYDGIFWVGIPSQRAVAAEPLFEYPFLRSIILRLPEFVRNSAIPPRYAMILGFDENGKVVYNLQDPGGKYDYITSGLQVGNTLYLGSLKEPSLAIYSLDNE